MLRIKVLHQHEDHAGVGRQMSQQRRKCFQSARRRPNADDRKGAAGRGGVGKGLAPGGFSFADCPSLVKCPLNLAQLSISFA